ncbi:Protein transport protein Sec61 subunit gamma [Capsicum annuum]|nr:Protein transport protein Sec61 subunit gamma [Capsicum annuum]
MDALDSVFDPLRDFAKDSVRLVKRCHKPDRKEFTKVATRTAIGFVVMGFVGATLGGTLISPPSTYYQHRHCEGEAKWRYRRKLSQNSAPSKSSKPRATSSTSPLGSQDGKTLYKGKQKENNTFSPLGQFDSESTSSSIDSCLHHTKQAQYEAQSNKSGLKAQPN